MPWFLLGILLLFGGLLLTRWFVKATPAQAATVLRVLALIVGGSVVLVLAVTGRLAYATMLVGALLPLFLRLRNLRQMWRNATGPSAGQRSEVSTRCLRMTLDHDTGAMSGTVLEGEYRGRSLEELTEAEQIDLLHALRVEDAESAALLEAYLDRIRPEWRHEAGGWGAGPAGGSGAGSGSGPRDRPAGTGPMSREEAYGILGLEPGATPEEIKTAHRALMQKLHPDRGGSTWLAARVNEARALLLDD